MTGAAKYPENIIEDLKKDYNVENPDSTLVCLHRITGFECCLVDLDGFGRNGGFDDFKPLAFLKIHALCCDTDDDLLCRKEMISTKF